MFEIFVLVQIKQIKNFLLDFSTYIYVIQNDAKFMRQKLLALLIFIIHAKVHALFSNATRAKIPDGGSFVVHIYAGNKKPVFQLHVQETTLIVENECFLFP